MYLKKGMLNRRIDEASPPAQMSKVNLKKYGDIDIQIKSLIGNITYFNKYFVKPSGKSKMKLHSPPITYCFASGMALKIFTFYIALILVWTAKNK